MADQLNTGHLGWYSGGYCTHSVNQMNPVSIKIINYFLKASRQSEADDESPLALQHRVLDERKQAESLSNPTPVMLEVLQRMEDREKERENMTWQQQLQHLTVSWQLF